MLFYDPTFHLVYFYYNYKNQSLPRGYVVFAKSLNCHKLGFHSNEKRVGTTQVLDFDLAEYNHSTYQMVDLRREFEKTN